MNSAELAWRSAVRPDARPLLSCFGAHAGNICIVRRRHRTRDELARAAADQMGGPDPAADRRSRPSSGSFFRATWRELDDEALRATGATLHDARRDRLPPDGRADAGRADPDAPGVLRPPRLLRRAIQRRARSRASARTPAAIVNLDALRRALHARLVGAHARRRLPAAAGGLAAVLPPRHAARLRAARARLPRARLDLRAVRGGDDAAPADRQPPAGLRRLLPDVQAGGPIVARLPRSGRSSTSRSSSAWRCSSAAAGSARCACFGVGRHLVDGRPLLHDPLRQAVPGGVAPRSSPASCSARCRCGRAASTPASWCTRRWRC